MTTAVELVEVKMTKKRKSNLARLALGVGFSRKLKTTFDMGPFARRGGWDDVSPSEVTNECGTTCCAMGHAPLFCDPPKPKEDWLTYSNRIISGDDIEVFCFLFDSDWPNDRKQFAARAWFVLKHGAVPEDYHRLDTYPVPRAKDLQPYIS